VFATARLTVEPLAPSHAAQLHAAIAHPEVGRFLAGRAITALDALDALDALRARIDRLAAGSPHPGERWWNFAVRLRADRTIIGQLEATSYGDWGEIAYLFGPRWWGQGLASEATRWLVRHLAAAGSHELWAAVHPDNERSKRLLARVGFLPATAPVRPLASFDPGDAVFVRHP
jgi:RimJ/RimL family protein N-acetyltransferase